MIDAQQVSAPETPPAASPFVPQAVALGKAFRDFARVEGDATLGAEGDRERIMVEAAERFQLIASLNPEKPVDALILLAILREFVRAIQPHNNLSDEIVQGYAQFMYCVVERLEEYISSASGTTLQAHGINLTDQPWN